MQQLAGIKKNQLNESIGGYDSIKESEGDYYAMDLADFSEEFADEIDSAVDDNNLDYLGRTKGGGGGGADIYWVGGSKADLSNAFKELDPDPDNYVEFFEAGLYAPNKFSELPENIQANLAKLGKMGGSKGVADKGGKGKQAGGFSLNESIGGYRDMQPLKEFDINEEDNDSNEDMKEAGSITTDRRWEYSDDEFDQEGGDPIQMAIQNLKSMFPGITDADIAEYLDTYQEYQSMGDGGEMNEKYKSDAQRKAVWASKNDEENGSKNEAKKGPKDAPKQTGGTGVVGKVSHNVKSFNTAPGEVAKDMASGYKKDAKKTALTGNKAMAYQPPHSRVYKENKIKPSSSEFTWDI
jgi:hypothetical protein